MSYISRWLLLVSVILQISNLEAILYSGHFFLYTLYYAMFTITKCENCLVCLQFALIAIADQNFFIMTHYSFIFV